MGFWGVDSGDKEGSTRQITPPITFVSWVVGSVQRIEREKEFGGEGVGGTGVRILW